MNQQQRDTVELFVSERDNQWYWHRLSANSNIIATGGEGYANFADCERMARHCNGMTDGVPTPHFMVNPHGESEGQEALPMSPKAKRSPEAAANDAACDEDGEASNG